MKTKSLTFNVDELLNKPEIVVPKLLNNDIELLIMELILAYIDRSIPLKTLITVVKSLKKYSKNVFTPVIDESIKNILELEPYERNIDEMLTDILEDFLKLK